MKRRYLSFPTMLSSCRYDLVSRFTDKVIFKPLEWLMHVYRNAKVINANDKGVNHDHTLVLAFLSSQVPSASDFNILTFFTFTLSFAFIILSFICRRTHQNLCLWSAMPHSVQIPLSVVFHLIWLARSS